MVFWLLYVASVAACAGLVVHVRSFDVEVVDPCLITLFEPSIVSLIPASQSRYAPAATGSQTEYALSNVAVPTGVVTETLYVPIVNDGLVTVMLVEEVNVVIVAEVVPNLTVVRPSTNLVPVRTIPGFSVLVSPIS